MALNCLNRQLILLRQDEGDPIPYAVGRQLDVVDRHNDSHLAVFVQKRTGENFFVNLMNSSNEEPMSIPFSFDGKQILLQLCEL